MNTLMKKLISSILALCMLLTLVPTAVYAAETAEEQIETQAAELSPEITQDDPPATRGQCGENASWELTEDGTLTIYGRGMMYDYFQIAVEGNIQDLTPWFGFCNRIKKIVIEDGITHIGRMAFYFCENVKTVTLSNSVTFIGDDAFNACESLTSVVIPSSVSYLGHCVFAWCHSLNKVFFEGNAPSSGVNCFHDVTATVYYPAGDPTWTADVRQNYWGNITWVAYEPDESPVMDEGKCGEDVYWKLAMDGTLTISGTGNMEDYTWYDSWYAPWYVFRDQIKKIVIEDGITHIGEYAFYRCDHLIAIEFADSITDLGAGAFQGCTVKTDVVLPNRLISIGYNAFAGLQTNSILIPNSVTYISGAAFQGADIDTITLPNSITYIPPFSFWNSTLTGIVIPDSVTRIDEGAFRNCSLTSVTIPASVTEIGVGAFYASESLKEVIFEGNAPSFDRSERTGENLSFVWVTLTAYYPAGDPTWTEEVRQDYGGNITWVAYEPDESPVMDEGKCGENVSWKICEDKTLIISGQGAVTDEHPKWRDYCDLVTRIVIGEGVTSVPANAFYMFNSTEEISIPASMQQIGSNAFYDTCTYLEKVSYPGTPSALAALLPSSLYHDYIVEVFRLGGPKTSGQCGDGLSWKLSDDGVVTVSGRGILTEPDWVAFAPKFEKIVLEDGVLEIASDAFTNCISVTSLTIPLNTQYIAEDADSGLWSLKKVYYPGSDVHFESICRDYNDNLLEAYQNTARIDITQQPEIYVGSIGTTAEFHVEATGEGLTYQWFYSPDGFSWSPSGLSGNKTDTLQVPFTANRVGQFYRCQITNYNGMTVKNSDAVFLCEALPPIAIVNQPVSFMGKTGELGVFHVDATGDGLTYQWYYSKDNGVTWSKSTMDGCQSDTLEVKLTAARAGQCYRCVIWDSQDNSMTSQQAAIKLETENIEIKYQPISVNGYIGDTATFHVEATGMGLTYQWYYSKDAYTWAVSSMAGSNTDTLKVQLTAARVGQIYRCAITDRNGNVVYSDRVTMNQKISTPGVLAIQGQPINFIGNLGDTAVFSVDAVGDSLTYQWQYCKAHSDWTNSSLPGSQTDTLRVDVIASRFGQLYRCIITDANGDTLISNRVAIMHA